MQLSVRAFLRRHAGQGREAFLDVVKVPHLLLRQRLQAPPPGEIPVTGSTQRVTAPEDASSPVNPMLFAVQKTPGANMFNNMVTIGRAPNNDVVIADVRVSRLQCFLRKDRGWWTVADTCSTNGTKVDGKVVPRDGTCVLNGPAKLLLADAIELEFLPPEALLRLLRDEAMAALVSKGD